MERFTSFDGVGLAYEVRGDGPTALLLHGFAADSSANWVRPGVADAIAESGRRVVLLDARGHGRSDKPHEPQAYADDAMIRDTQLLLDHLGVERVDVCGYSMGAMTTFALVARESRARSAVLGGVGARLRGRALADRAPRIAEALESDEPPDVTDATARAFRAFADSTGADRRALAAIQRAHRARLPEPTEITVPTLVITGDRDTLVGSGSELADQIPGARSRTVSGDHLTAVYDPAFRAAIVDFLAEVEAGTAGRSGP